MAPWWGTPYRYSDLRSRGAPHQSRSNSEYLFLRLPPKSPQRFVPKRNAREAWLCCAMGAAASRSGLSFPWCSTKVTPTPIDWSCRSPWRLQRLKNKKQNKKQRPWSLLFLRLLGSVSLLLSTESRCSAAAALTERSGPLTPRMTFKNI